MILSGNQAITKALKESKAFLASYPITPISEILQAYPSFQAEDEIASINAAIGASLAGKKAVTTTSGPGLSLMQESIGFAFKIATPLLIINAQRVGPSTGKPTYPSQGDILAAKHGSHGDYTNIVLYPNSVEEGYKYTIKALNAAEESKSPVILLTDATLNKMHETTQIKKIKTISRKTKPLGQGKRYFTGLVNEEYTKWYKARKKQILDTAKKYDFYQYKKNKSNTLIISYGILSRVVSELKGDHFRPITLFPISPKLKSIAKNYKKIVVIEMNDSQYANEIQAYLKREVKSISQLGGEINLDEIKKQLY